MCGIKLAAVDGIGAGGADSAGGHILNLALAACGAYGYDIACSRIITGKAAISEAVYGGAVGGHGGIGA